MSKETMKESLKKMFGRRFKAGSYSMFAVAMVLAIAIVFNLIVGALPASETQIDISGTDLLKLSDQTKRIVTSVNKDVTMYLITNTGDEDATLQRLLERYAGLNSHVSWKVLDPTNDPTFLNSYDLSVGQLYENSVLVDCDGKYRLVGYDEIYVTTYDYDYYSYNYSTSTTFEGENALTNAIHYVASENLPKVYIISGHGESELSGTVTDGLEQDNFEYEKLSLLSLESIPEDAAALILNEPSSDLGEDEASLLTDYLGKGGKLILTTAYTEKTLPNLMKVTESMGLTAGEGMILEGDRNMRLSRYPYYLLPDMAETDETSALIADGYYILVPLARPITETEGSGASVTWLLTTSSSAYAKLNATNMTTTAKEDGDTDGPFHVGAISDMNGGRLVWISGDGFLSDNVNSAVSGANLNLYLNILNGMSGQTESISIRGVALENTGLTVPSASSGFWSVVMIGVIPAALVLAGVIIMLRRKRK